MWSISALKTAYIAHVHTLYMIYADRCVAYEGRIARDMFHKSNILRKLLKTTLIWVQYIQALSCSLETYRHQEYLVLAVLMERFYQECDPIPSLRRCWDAD